MDWLVYEERPAPMTIESASYGESRLRMLRVIARGDRHDPRDLTIGLRFEGRLDAMVPGEAIKNLVHRVVREHDQAAAAIETLGIAICDAILRAYASIGLARVELTEQPWARLDAGGKAQGQAFLPAGAERRTAVVTGNGARTAVQAGVENLILLRTGGFVPAGRGGPTDDPAADGLPRVYLATLGARWAYTAGDIAFVPYRAGVRQAIVETFVWHKGPTALDTLRAMADVILASYQEIAQVSLTLQERPYRPVDLLELAVDTDALFVAHDEPVGVLEVSVERGAI
jgi:urate oxidase